MRRKAETTKTRQPARDINKTMRQLQAIELRKQGREWQEISDLCGIRGGKGAAYKLVNDALKAALRESAEEYRELLAQRLDKLWAIQFAKATDPTNKSADWAIDRCLAIHDRQERLFNLALKPDATQQQAQMVLIGVPQTVLEAI